MSLLDVKNVDKIYVSRFGTNKVVGLEDITFSVEDGEYIAIMGESGSGKTTLLNVLSSLDKVSSGEVLLDGEDISKIKDDKLSEFRRDNMGFVFQEFHLLNNFSVKDNIALPLVFAKVGHEEIERRVLEIAKALNIESLLSKQPYELSGGQKQRVTVARAVINNPKLIFADEPTGALDSKSAENLLDILDKLNDKGQTILMVTHSVRAASRAKRVLFIKDGKLFHQIYRGNNTNVEMNQKISEVLTFISTGGETNE